MGKTKRPAGQEESNDPDYNPSGSGEGERRRAELRTKTRNEPLRVFQRVKKAISRRDTSASTSAPAHSAPPAQPDVPAPAPDGNTLIFRDDAQRVRYDVLARRVMMPTKFVDIEWMRKLGLEDDLKAMFKKLGLVKLWGADWYTYPRYVLEFLSSVTGVKSGKADITLSAIKFRLDGVERKMTVAEFGSIYQFHVKGERDRHENFPCNEFWKRITGEVGKLDEDGDEEPVYNASSSKASKIVNPVFRYFHRLMALSIQARGDSQGNVRLTELCFMWSIFCDSGKLDIGYYLLHQLLTVSKRDKGKIFIGGMLTPLFRHYGCDLDGALTLTGSRLLDEEALSQSLFFTREGSLWFWKEPRLQLPNTEITTLRRRENWLLTGLGGGASTSQQPPEMQPAGEQIDMIDMDQLMSDPQDYPTPATHFPPSSSGGAGTSFTDSGFPMPDTYPSQAGSSFSFADMAAFVEEYREHRARQDAMMRDIFATQAQHGTILRRLEMHFFPPPAPTQDDAPEFPPSADQ